VSVRHTDGTASKVTCDLAMSLDGYVAGRNQSMDDPFGEGAGEVLHKWMFDEPDENAAALAAMDAPTAYAMGRNMFGPGRGAWDENWKGWRGTEQVGGTHYYLDMTALGRQEDWEEPHGRASYAPLVEVGRPWASRLTLDGQERRFGIRAGESVRVEPASAARPRGRVVDDRDRAGAGAPRAVCEVTRGGLRWATLIPTASPGHVAQTFTPRRSAAGRCRCETTCCRRAPGAATRSRPGRGDDRDPGQRDRRTADTRRPAPRR
jgi:hypothetical protein